MRISIFAYMYKMNISCMHMQLRCIFSKSVVSKFHRVYYKGCICIVQCVVSMFLRVHQNRIYFTVYVVSMFHTVHQNCIYFIVCGFNVSQSTLELFLFYSLWFQCFIEYIRVLSILQCMVSRFQKIVCKIVTLCTDYPAS